MNEDQVIQTEINNMPTETTRRSGENEAQVNQTIQRYSSEALSILPNWQERTMVRKFSTQELQQGFEYRQQALQMALDTRLQSMEEACNHVLVTGKAELRQQRSFFFARKLSELKQQMDKLALDFNQRVDGQLQRLEQYKSERIREREQQRLEKSVEDFMDTLDQLADNFINIVNEGVKR